MKKLIVLGLGIALLGAGFVGTDENNKQEHSTNLKYILYSVLKNTSIKYL